MWSAGASSKRISYVSAIADHAMAENFLLTFCSEYIKKYFVEKINKCTCCELYFIFSLEHKTTQRPIAEFHKQKIRPKSDVL